MTINTESTKRIYSGNGTTTDFDYDFKIFVDTDLLVTLIDAAGNETVQVLNTDYTVTGEGFEAGGKVKFTSAPAAGVTVLIQSNVPYTQPTDLKNQGRFFPETMENSLDRATRQILQVADGLDRSLTLPPYVTGVSTQLPVPESSKLIGWDAAASRLRNYGVDELATVAAYAQKVYQTFTGDGVTTTFLLSNDPVSLGNLDVSIDGVTQVPAADYTISGNNIIFSPAPSNGSVVLVRYDLGLPAVSGEGEANTASNLGSGAGVFASKSGVDLRFKSIKAGANVTITPSGTEIEIAAAGGGGGGGTWGSITGTLSAQTDLQAALNAKAASVHAHAISDVTGLSSALAAKVDAATLAASGGSSLVGFIRTGTGAVARTVQAKLRDYISLLDFIPESEHAAIRNFTSTYDATAAINNAYAQAKAVRGTLWCPSGRYNISSTITLDGQVSLIGEGCSASDLDMEGVDVKARTMFRWVGADGGTVFQQVGRTGAIDIGNFVVNCRNSADVGIQFDRLRGSRIFSVMVVNWRPNQAGKAGILIKPQPIQANDNFMFNDIGPLYLRGPTCCLRLAAADGSSNVCHNTFRQLTLDARNGTTNYGMVIEDADNNTFSMTYTFTFGGTGNFAVVHEAASRSNYFFHFQGTMWAKPGSKNIVFGYDRENGHPQPTVDPGAELFWTENGNNAWIWNMTSMLRGVCVEQSGDWTPGNATFVDRNAFKHVRPDIGAYASWTFRNSPRRYEMWISVDGNGPYNMMSLANNAIGFFGASPQLKPTVTGSKGGNAALTSLLTALASMGLITDSST